MTRNLLNVAASVLFLLALPILCQRLAESHAIVQLFINVSPTGFTIDDALQTMRIFAPVFIIAMLLQLWLNRAEENANTRLVRGLYSWFAVWGICTSCVFLFTNIPFEASYFAWKLLIGAAFVIVLHLVDNFVIRSGKRLTFGVVGKVFSALIKPLPLLAVLVGITPGILMVVYKLDPKFTNAINLLRRTATADQTHSLYTTNAFDQGSFRQPMAIKFSDGDPGYAYVLERHGKLLKVSWPDGNQRETVLDFTDQDISQEFENGTLGFALHPEFGQSSSPAKGWVFIYYTLEEDGATHNILMRADLSSGDATTRITDAVQLIKQRRQLSNGFHNGGEVEFGSDGFLYLAIGDLSDIDYEHPVSRHFAAGILRLDVDKKGGDISHPIRRTPDAASTDHYFIPSDNPFVDRPDTLEEYWAMGLRNPFRFSFDPQTGAMWIGEVGDSFYEEVNVATSGGNNFQWPFAEGFEMGDRDNFNIVGNETPPHYAYKHTAVDRAVIGGLVYRNDRYPMLQGKYLFGDNGSGRLLSIPIEGSDLEAEEFAFIDQLGQLGLAGFSLSPEGDILIVTLGRKDADTGIILKVTEEKPSDSDSEATVAPVPAITKAGVESNYRSDCARCHALTGMGDEKVADQLGISMPDFTDSGWQKSKSDEYLYEVLEKGGQAMGLSVVMPAWGEAYSAEEIELMVQIIRDFEKN